MEHLWPIKKIQILYAFINSLMERPEKGAKISRNKLNKLYV